MSTKIKSFKLGVPGFEMLSVMGGYSIISNEHPNTFKDLKSVIKKVSINDTDIMSPGGNESVITKKLKAEFEALGWNMEIIAHKENHFEIKKGKEVVNDYKGKPLKLITNAMSHKMDGFHNDKYGNIALEIEWNTRKEFLERDITAWQSLYENGYIDAAIVIIKDEELQKNIIKEIYKNYFTAKGPYRDIDHLISVCMTDITAKQKKSIENSSTKKGLIESAAQVITSNRFGGTHAHFGNLETLVDQGKVKLPLLIINITKDAIKGKFI